jgi:hypothetical protein
MSTENDGLIVAGEHINGYFYGYFRYFSDGKTDFVKISTNNWTTVSATVTTILGNVTDIAYDFSTNTMYGILLSNAGIELVTIDIETGKTNYIGYFNNYMLALACSKNGQLYCMDMYATFYSVNKTNALVRLIANTGLVSRRIHSMAFDHNTGRLFWTYSNFSNSASEWTGKLFEIDHISGATFERGKVGNNDIVNCLFTKYTHTKIISHVAENSIKIFPNPTANQLKITNYKLQENTVIEIYDVVGRNVGTNLRVCPEQQGEHAGSPQQITIDISHLSAGMYFLKVDNRTIKVIKE